jgi:hypothetical protein
LSSSNNNRRKTTSSSPSAVVVEVSGVTSQQQEALVLEQGQTKTSCYNSAQMRAAKVIGSAWKKCFASQTTLRLIGKFKDAKLMSTDIQDMR